MIAKPIDKVCDRAADGVHVFNPEGICVHCEIGRRRVESVAPAPVHRLGVSFIAAVPDGAKLMVFNDRIFVVAPSMAPCWVTPTGLVPVQLADGSDLK